MSLISVFRLFKIKQGLAISAQYSVQIKNPAGSVKKSVKKQVVAEKITIPVEKDVNKLLSHVCGTNLLKEGGEDVKIKPDSEYPDWLWNIRTEPARFEDLDKNTKQYWKYLRREYIKRKNRWSKFYGLH
ncbi:mitochondrial ribosomal protein L54 [Augochlora pura]